MVTLRELLNENEIDYLKITTIRELIDLDKSVIDLTVLDLNIIGLPLIKSEIGEKSINCLIPSKALEILVYRAIKKNLPIFE